jgi:hypothetical protein
MQASQRTQWLCAAFCSRAPGSRVAACCDCGAGAVLDTRPPELLERLRSAAPQLGLHQGEITAIALDRLLAEYGC